ncbi:hypothetical protein KAR91_48600 [Candidatus Pacearchaeota archaeon]|nr:hypothetical protein [Candidatus Pacearchaeota archaeon]
MNPFSDTLNASGRAMMDSSDVEFRYMRLPANMGAGFVFADPPKVPKPVVLLPRIDVTQLNSVQKTKWSALLGHEVGHYNYSSKEACDKARAHSEFVGDFHNCLEDARSEIKKEKTMIGVTEDIIKYRFIALKEMNDDSHMANLNRWGTLFQAFKYYLPNYGIVQLPENLVPYFEDGLKILNRDDRWTKACQKGREGCMDLVDLAIEMHDKWQIRRSEEKKQQEEEKNDRANDTGTSEDSQPSGDDGENIEPESSDTSQTPGSEDAEGDDQDSSGEESSEEDMPMVENSDGEETSEENPQDEEDDPQEGQSSDGEDPESDDKEQGSGMDSGDEGEENGDSAVPVQGSDEQGDEESDENSPGEITDDEPQTDEETEGSPSESEDDNREEDESGEEEEQKDSGSSDAGDDGETDEGSDGSDNDESGEESSVLKNNEEEETDEEISDGNSGDTDAADAGDGSDVGTGESSGDEVQPSSEESGNGENTPSPGEDDSTPGRVHLDSEGSPGGNSSGTRGSDSGSGKGSPGATVVEPQPETESGDDEDGDGDDQDPTESVAPEPTPEEDRPESIQDEYKSDQGNDDSHMNTDELGLEIAALAGDDVDEEAEEDWTPDNSSERMDDEYRHTPTSAGNPYIPYTKQDREIKPCPDAEAFREIYDDISGKAKTMSRELRKILIEQSRTRTTRGLRLGRLDKRMLHRVIKGSNRVHYKKQMGRSVDTAVSLLIDLSGSMSGQKARLAARVATLFAEAINPIPKTAFELLGYNSSPLSYEIQHDAKFSGYTRTEIINYWLFKEFADPWNLVRHRLGATEYSFSDTNPELGGACDGCNVDHENVLHAARRLWDRPEHNKVMIVFCDGAPHGYNGTYGGLLDKKLIEAVKKVRDVGIKLFCYGIQSPRVEQYYAPDFHLINNLDDLDTRALKTLGSYLLNKRK